MTKKDYIIIGTVLKNQPLVDANLNALGVFDYKIRLISSLMQAFELDNDRFSKKQFLEFIK